MTTSLLASWRPASLPHSLVLPTNATGTLARWRNNPWDLPRSCNKLYWRRSEFHNSARLVGILITRLIIHKLLSYMYLQQYEFKPDHPETYALVQGMPMTDLLPKKIATTSSIRLTPPGKLLLSTKKLKNKISAIS